jgi:hypothetical protein
MSVALPKTPTGHELEEYFAALLQATGHYVWKNIEEPNILELDIVATDYREDKPRSRVFEVKGTEPELGEIFKLLGRMHYLGLDEGAFVATSAPRERDAEWFERVCKSIAIKFIVVDDLDKSDAVFDEHGFGRAKRLAHGMWRYSYWIERIYITALRQLRRERPDLEMPKAALRYYRLVNSGVFLTADATEKVGKIYEAYQEHPGLTAELADELSPSGDGRAMTKEALNRGAHTVLQATWYLEHRARLSILKAATDYLIAGGPVSVPVRGGVRKEGDKLVIDFGIVSLPDSFLRGLHWLSKQKQYTLYPLFWQNLLWGWGGVLPDQHRKWVLSEIARASGLDPSNAEIAITAMDQLFPVDNGWWRHFDNADYAFVMLTPFHFQGLGVFHQMVRFRAKTYPEYVTTGEYTARDFARRNNALVRLVTEASAAP